MTDEQNDANLPAELNGPARAVNPHEINWREDAKQKPDEKSAPSSAPTSSYAPIVGQTRLGRFDFLRRQQQRPWIARVYLHSNGRLSTYDADKQPTTGELIWGGLRSQYEVDLSLRRLALEFTLPTAGDAFVFRAEVDVQWRVINPLLVVRAGIVDVRRVLVPPLMDRLRRDTRSQQARDVEQAEKAANAGFEHDWLPEDYGLWTRVLVRMRMDKQQESALRLTSEVQVFKALIAGGDLDQFALQLAQNPSQVEPVVRALVEERDTHRGQVFDFINELLASDALERWQIDDQVVGTLEWLKNSINRVISGNDETRQLNFGNGNATYGSHRTGSNGSAPRQPGVPE